jgi:hypothetical protein
MQSANSLKPCRLARSTNQPSQYSRTGTKAVGLVATSVPCCRQCEAVEEDEAHGNYCADPDKQAARFMAGVNSWSALEVINGESIKWREGSRPHTI